MAKKNHRAVRPAKQEPSGTIAVVIESKPNKQLVDEAVVWIRNKLAETAFKGLAQIGDYVFSEFFGGDVERLKSQDPTKNASFSLLVKRCETTELPMSRSSLHRAVGVAVMLRRLANDGPSFKQLPPTHQATLLPLKEPERVERTAHKALSKKLSVSSLRKIVYEELAKLPHDGRRAKPKPAILRSLDRSNRIFAAEAGKRGFTKVQLDELSIEQKKKALLGARRLADSLARLIQRLEPR